MVGMFMQRYPTMGHSRHLLASIRFQKDLPAVAFAALAIANIAVSMSHADGWTDTKNIADDIIYEGRSHTFYCGCAYTSDGDRDGSGRINPELACGYEGSSTHSHRAGRVEWEHIVPASLMPARQRECWSGPGGSRSRCEDSDPVAQAMIFDLHNLAPSIGQVNALRSNDRYGELPEWTSDFGACLIEDTNGTFSPPPCLRGDVARVWFYMREAHGVEILPEEEAMFARWAEADPVSPWERERERRIARHSRINNPFVDGVEPDEAGACVWE